MTGQELKRQMLVNQSKAMFTSPPLIRKANQATVEAIAKTIYESNDLWAAADEEYQDAIISTLEEKNLMGTMSKRRPKPGKTRQQRRGKAGQQRRDKEDQDD